MNITVFLGASMGGDQMYVYEVRTLGKWIGENGHRLIYGGSKIGLMGVLADTVLENGGEVIGIEPSFFLKDEMKHDGLTQMIVTETIEERRTKMIEMGRFYRLPRRNWNTGGNFRSHFTEKAGSYG